MLGRFAIVSLFSLPAYADETMVPQSQNISKGKCSGLKTALDRATAGSAPFFKKPTGHRCFMWFISERRHRRPAQRTAEQHGEDGAVAQPLGGRDVRCVQERLPRVSQFPVRTSMDFALFTRAMPAANRRQPPVVRRRDRQRADGRHADDDDPRLQAFRWQLLG
jgi:hypothetical protein